MYELVEKAMENILEDSIFESRPEQLTIEEFVKLTKKVSNETI